MSWRAGLSLLLCFLLLSSISQPLVMASTSGEQGASENTSDQEEALDNYPSELQELVEKQKHFFATFRYLENTLGEIENALQMLENDFTNWDELQLDNLIDEFGLRTENFENEASDLLLTLEGMDNFPVLVNENGENTWKQASGEIDNEFKAWPENLAYASYELDNKLRTLQENLNLDKLEQVLEQIDVVREIIGSTPPNDTVNLEDLWFERLVGGSWVRTTWAYQGDSIRVRVQLHNTDWLARGRTWLDWSGLGWVGWLYWDLAVAQRVTTTLLETSASSPGNYNFSAWGRWEAWTWVFVWIKVGEGDIPEQEITLEVRNIAPTSDAQPAEPDEPKPWGTTFTYWTVIDDPDGHWVGVTLYKDGVQYGDSKWVQGSGTPTWTWTSTSADIGVHDYYFVASDGYDTTRDPPTGTHSGPTVTKRSTSLSMSASPTELLIGQSTTFSGYLTDDFTVYYTFLDSVNNTAWERYSSTSKPDRSPSELYAWSPNGNATSGDYAAISYSDDIRWITSYGGDKDVQYYKFEIQEAPSTISQIDVLWEGYGDVLLEGDPWNDFWIWKESTEAWVWIGMVPEYYEGTSTLGWLVYDRPAVYNDIQSNFGDYLYNGNELFLAASAITDVEETCPILYAWTADGRYEFISDASINGGLGFHGYLGSGYLDSPFQIPGPEDYVVIDGSKLASEDGMYKLVVGADQKEIYYFDSSELLTVYHPQGTEIYSSTPIYSAPPYPDTKFYTVRNPTPPRFAYINNVDVLEHIRSPDDIRTTQATEFAYDVLTLDLGDLSGAEQIKLLMKASQEWVNKPPFIYQIDYVEVPDEDGNWVRLEDTRIPNWTEHNVRTFVVDITDWFLTDDYRLRLNSWHLNYYDYIAVDTSLDEPVIILESTPTSADLFYKGVSRPGNTELFDYYNTSDAYQGLFTGYFTRYGDVLELVSETDDKFVIMNPGDAIDIRFRKTDQEYLIDSMPILEKDFILISDSYYKMEFVKMFLGENVSKVEPLPFHGMSYYPYPENEHYPSDEEHLAYLEEYNTRYIAPPTSNEENHHSLYMDYVEVKVTSGLGSNTVKLQKQEPGWSPDRWENTSASDVTSSNGYYSITITPMETSYYRTRFEGDTLYYSSTSSVTVVQVNKPDLIIDTDISWTINQPPLTSSEVCPTVDFVVKVKNQGNGTALNSYLDFYIGESVSQFDVPSISVGSTYDVTFSHTFDSPGTYSLEAVADATYVLSEDDETNNERPGQITVEFILPDLEVTGIPHSISQPPRSTFDVYPGDVVDFTVELANWGERTTPGFYVDFYYPDGFKESVYVSGLSGESTWTRSFEYRFSDSGSYNVKAVADTTGAVWESNETNNDKLIDVAVESITAPYVQWSEVEPESPVEMYTTYTVSINVKNPNDVPLNITVTTYEDEPDEAVTTYGDTPAPDKSQTKVIPANGDETFTFTYSHDWRWLKPLEEDSTRRVLNWIISFLPGGEVVQLIQVGWNIVGYLETEGSALPQITYTYNFASVPNVGGLGPSYQTVTVPDEKVRYLGDSWGNTIAAGAATDSGYAFAALAAGLYASAWFTFGGTIPAAVIASAESASFFALEVNLLIKADRYMEWSYDPDPNYQEVVVPEPVSIPELDSLLEGSGKEAVKRSFTLLANLEAAQAAWGKYQGAKVAGDTEWMLIHLSATQNYSNLVQADYQVLRELIGAALVDLQKSLEESIFPITEAEIQAMQERIREEGLPQTIVDTLKEVGYTDNDIATIVEIIENVPASSYVRDGMFDVTLDNNEVQAVKEVIKSRGLPQMEENILRRFGYTDDDIAAVVDTTQYVLDNVVVAYSQIILDLIEELYSQSQEFTYELQDPALLPPEIEEIPAPTVSVVHSPDQPTYAQSITFTVTSTDELGVTQTKLYVDGDNVATWSGGGTFTYVGGPYGYGTHTYSAIALNTAGYMGGDPEVGVKSFFQDPIPPPTPELVSPENGGATNDATPTFEWSSVTDPSGVTYTLQVDNDPDFSSPEVDNAGLTPVTYTPATALADDNYSWRVRAHDGAGNVGDWSEVWTLLIDTIPPAAPLLQSPENGLATDKTPLLDWSDVSDLSGVTYTLEIDDNSDFSSPELVKTDLTASQYELILAEALSFGTYYWRARAVDGAGNLGDWSSAWQFAVVPKVLIDSRTYWVEGEGAGRTSMLKDNLEAFGYLVEYGDSRVLDLAEYKVIIYLTPWEPLPTALTAWVEAGGGLLLLDQGDYGGHDQTDFVNAGLEALGINARFNDDEVLDNTTRVAGRSYKPAFRRRAGSFEDDTIGLTDGIQRLGTDEVKSLVDIGEGVVVLVKGDDDSYNQNADNDPIGYTAYAPGDHPPVLAAAEVGLGRVVFGGLSKTLVDPYIGYSGVVRLVKNVASWLTIEVEQPLPPIMAPTDVIVGSTSAVNVDKDGVLPWVWYGADDLPPIMVAERVGEGAVLAAGTAATSRNWRWTPGEWDVLLDVAFQWMKPGAENVLWYEGYGVYSDTYQSSDLVSELEAKGYNITGDNTEPITADLLASYDILVIPQLELGDSGTGGDPSLLPDADVAAITDFVEAGGGLLVMEGSDSLGYNYYKVQNKILGALGMGVYFQSDQVDDPEGWRQFDALINTSNEIGAAYQVETGLTVIQVYSVCSLTYEAPLLTLMIAPSDDAAVYESDPDTPEIRTDRIGIRTWDNSHDNITDYRNVRSFVKFDLSGIPEGATITDARLDLYKYYAGYTISGVTDVEVMAVDDDWEENTVTWNTQPQPSGYVIDSWEVPPLGVWASWTVTDFVAGEFGGDATASLRLRASVEYYDDQWRNVYFRSKDYFDSYYHPYLEVTYTLA